MIQIKIRSFKSKGRKNKVKVNGSIFFFVLVILFFSSCNDGENNQQWSHTPSFPVFEVAKGNYTVYNTYPTKLEGTQEIEIRAKVGGYVQNIFVDEGQFVEKGQLLFKLEANDISQNTNAASAAIKTAEANVNLAKIEVARLKPLVEENIISTVQLQTAEANLESAKAQLNQANSAYYGFKASEDYTTILSPTDGFIGKLDYRKGSLVGPSDGRPLTTVSNTKEVYAYFSVSEQELTMLIKSIKGKDLSEKLKALPKLQLQLADGSLYEHEGTMDASIGKISKLTGAMQLRAKFINPNNQLLSGNSGVIKIPRYYKDIIAIPASTTFEIQGISMVYVLKQGDTLKSTPINIIDKENRYFIISDGLNLGDKVLAQGVSKVYPNTVIAPYLVSMDSIAKAFNTVFK